MKKSSSMIPSGLWCEWEAIRKFLLSLNVDLGRIKIKLKE